MGQIWHERIGWLSAGGWLGAFFAAQLLLVLFALPLWLRFLDRRRWVAMRRELVREAFATHVAATDAAAVLAGQLLGEGQPLARLQKVRGAIERHRAARERFAQKLAIHSSAMNGRLAVLSGGVIDFGDAATETFAVVTRLYLKEASLRLAPAVVHGEDFLGFEAGQIVALPWLSELEEAAARFVAAEAEDRVRVTRALRRRDRVGRVDEVAACAQNAEMLAAAIRALGPRLHADDPESVNYRSRKQGERSARTLDGLIARFDRGGATG